MRRWRQLTAEVSRDAGEVTGTSEASAFRFPAATEAYAAEFRSNYENLYERAGVSDAASCVRPGGRPVPGLKMGVRAPVDVVVLWPFETVG
jgi:hypothetical protein